jgi:acetyl esterase/lipase
VFAVYCALIGIRIPGNTTLESLIPTHDTTHDTGDTIGDTTDNDTDHTVENNLFIMADSSGCCLALQLLLLLDVLQIPKPKGMVLLSPFVDNGTLYTLQYYQNAKVKAGSKTFLLTI